MRKSIVTILFLLVSGISFGQQKFYYHFDNKIMVDKLDNQYFVKIYTQNVNQKYKVLLNNSLDNFEVIDSLRPDLYILKLSNVEYKNLLSEPSIQSVYPVYKTKQGFSFLCFNEIVVKPQRHLSELDYSRHLKNFGLKLTRKMRLYDVLTCSKSTDVIKVSNQLFETGDFKYCHPNFNSEYKPNDVFPTDSFFNMQYYLHNTGQQINHGHSGTLDADIDAPEAWEISKGSPEIVIAVIDQGVTPNHPDLPNSRQLRLDSSNIGGRVDGTNVNDPTPTGNNNHGNACAGIIAATHDNEGIAGIAPNCIIMPIRVAFGINGNSTTDFADAITFANDNGADIISNSWGGGPPGSVIEDAIADAIANGRNNRGAIVAFSAGNFANNNNIPLFPSAANIRGLLCVGASTRDDGLSLYSATGDPVDVVAPSHTAFNSQDANESYNVWTIDIPDSAGYNVTQTGREDNLNAVGSMLPSSGTNFLSYTGRMGGTSAACPQVAGVAALMLSENPCLTALEIESIIKRNADKVGGFDYQQNSSRPGHSLEMGFGRLNAHRALTDIIFIQNETFSSSPNVIKSNGTIIVGDSVTTSMPFGNVVVTSSGSLKLIAGRKISIQEGFSTEMDADFEAEVIPNTDDCIVWDAAFIIPKDKGNWIPDYNSPINHQIVEKELTTKFDVKIYPNPGTESINLVSYNGEISKIEILSLEGKNVLSSKVESTNGNIDIVHLSNGIYFSRIYSSYGEVKVLRFIKE